MNLLLPKKNVAFFFIATLTLLICKQAKSQCSVAPTATSGITLQCGAAITNYRTGLTYSPVYHLYYSVDAGDASDPIETFGSTGDSLSAAPQGFDYRGIWWNGNTQQLDGNVYNGLGIINATLDSTTHYATGGGTYIYSTNSMPYSQSVGDYDSAHNYIIYYRSGSIYQYNYSTNTLANTKLVAGLPVLTSNLSANTVVYTGCPGKEYAVYDYVNRAVYFLDVNANYVATSQLPSTAEQPSAYGVAWANGMFWLFNTSNSQWHSYNVFSSSLPVTLTNISAKYTASTVRINWATANEVNISKYILQKSSDAKTFNNAYAVSAKTGNQNQYEFTDNNVVSRGVIYYRLKMEDVDGNFSFSKVVAVSINGSGSFFTITPNPARSFTTLNFGQQMQQAEIAIYSLDGRRLLSQTISSPSTTYPLNVQSLLNGMYIISVKTASDTYNQKLVINK